MVIVQALHNPDGYTLSNHGTIQDPGKYESEPVYVPYFAELDGPDDTLYDGDLPVDVYRVDPEDRAKFPGLLEDVYAVILWTSDNGFCNSRAITTEGEYDDLVTQLEQDADGEDDHGQ